MKKIQIFEYQTHTNHIQDVIKKNEQAKWIFLGYAYHALLELRNEAGMKDNEILLQDEIEDSSRTLRHPFIDYIASVTTDKGDHPNLYSGLVERVPFRSDVFLDICLIHATIEKIKLCKADSIVVICQHKGLAYDFHQSFSNEPDIQHQIHVEGPVFSLKDRIFSSVRVMLHAGKISTQLLCRKSISILRKKNSFSYERMENGILLLHSWVAQASIESGEYKEVFFSDLREKLTKLGYPVVLLPHIPYDVNFSAAFNALEKKQIHFIPEESCISVLDIIKIFLKTVRNVPRWSDHTVQNISFSNSVYIQNYRDWENLQILIPCLCERIIAGLSREKVPIRTLIFTYENNAWEKAFIKKIRENYEETTSIGYQHSTLTPNYLYYYVSKSPIDQKYIPDYVITNGEYPTSFLTKNNFPHDRIITGGALRYQSGKQTPSIQLGSLQYNNRILVTPPGLIDEAVELLEKVFEALGTNPELEIFVKIHPFLSRTKLEEKLPPDLIKRIRYATRPLHEILPDANLLVYSTTSTCIEALSMGIPVLKIKSEHRLDLDPLGDFQGSTPFIAVATQPEEIKDTILKMKELHLTESDKIVIQRIVKSIFGPANDETYHKFTLLKNRV